MPQSKQQRQEGALNRFRILPFNQWAEAVYGTQSPDAEMVEAVKGYDLYRSAKDVELNRLKASLNVR